MKLTHIDERGNAVMVDVGEKEPTKREALATGIISMSEECFTIIKDKKAKKGDVLGVAQVAGIMASKRTAELIPLCHVLNLTHSSVDFVLNDKDHTITAHCTVRCAGKTGVEMEALTGVSISLLTIYDMCKAIDKRMEISDIHLVKKTGGKSGTFTYEESEEA